MVPESQTSTEDIRDLLANESQYKTPNIKLSEHSLTYNQGGYSGLRIQTM